MNEIFERTSVRQFLDKEVTHEQAVQLMKAAMQAPSACNQQPWEFYLVKNKEILKQLSQCSPYAKMAADAPFAIVPCFRTEGMTAPAYVKIDMSNACENILLEAVSLKLGAVWLGICPDSQRVKAVGKVLNLPESLKAFAIILVGYPKEEPHAKNRYDESRIHGEYLK
jgi:nitroreductase